LEISKINFNTLLQNNRHKIGTVINLDYHNQSGSHWVALYADLAKHEIYYFDSYGIRPKPEIVDFIKKIKTFCDNKCKHEKKNPDTIVKYNRTRHQYENSECGVYSINMILKMLKGVAFDKHNKVKIKDKLINRCRYKYFSNRIQGLDG
jgi:Ulp1 family protease